MRCSTGLWGSHCWGCGSGEPLLLIQQFLPNTCLFLGTSTLHQPTNHSLCGVHLSQLPLSHAVPCSCHFLAAFTQPFPIAIPCCASFRDRLYEAGFDESVTLAWLGHTFGEMPTPEFARYAAVALVACLGIAGFAAGALWEREALKRLQVLDK